jgi:protein-S-isoprenylcysteine O-methyltransferase Ste14
VFLFGWRKRQQFALNVCRKPLKAQGLLDGRSRRRHRAPVMKLPSWPHFALLFVLGFVFLHFMLAGARTFYSANMQDERGAPIAQFSFVFSGVIPTWFLGLYHPIQATNGIAAAIVLLLSVTLYEWARNTIWGRHFGVGWGEHVPEALCEREPYRFIRHPIYLSYMLAFGAVLIALPHWISALMFAMNVALFTHAAITDERTLASSALAADYAGYRGRAGMFWPRFS